MSALEDIERRRLAQSISIADLCASASIDPKHYWELRRRKKAARPPTIARLDRALDRLRRGIGAEAGAMAPAVAFRACLYAASLRLGVAPRAAMLSVPSRRATASPEWRQAATVRRVAVWLANQMFGFRQSDLARAAGVTKQMVSEALKELEDQRDTDPALDQVLTEMEEVFAT